MTPKTKVLTAQCNLIAEAMSMQEANTDDLAFDDQEYIDELVCVLVDILAGDHEVFMETAIFFLEERPEMLPRG